MSCNITKLPPRVLSLCTSAGLWDRVLIENGFSVAPGCEIEDHKRRLYNRWCGPAPYISLDIRDLPEKVEGFHFDGVVGGIPCQAHSKLKSRHKPKFGDLTSAVCDVLNACEWKWFCFENVVPLEITGAHHVKLDAKHFGKPHQSRPRWFTISENLVPFIPPALYGGTTYELKAYPSVVGRIYSVPMSAWLQGYPHFSELMKEDFSADQVKEALADGVPACLANSWIPAMREAS